MIQEYGYGPLQLNPEQLGRLTLGEFLQLLKGWEWREKHHMKRLAQLASWVTAPHLKKPIHPEKLLKGQEKTRKKTNQAKSQAVINELMQEMGVE